MAWLVLALYPLTPHAPSHANVIEQIQLVNTVFWLPFGYHVMFIGLDSEQILINQTMPYDVILQKVPKQARTELVDWNNDFFKECGDEDLRALFEEARRWMSLAS